MADSVCISTRRENSARRVTIKVCVYFVVVNASPRSLTFSLYSESHSPSMWSECVNRRQPEKEYTLKIVIMNFQSVTKKKALINKLSLSRNTDASLC